MIYWDRDLPFIEFYSIQDLQFIIVEKSYGLNYIR
jgi:hypothetical protein